MSSAEIFLQYSIYTFVHDLGELESATVKNSSFNEGDIVEMTTKVRLQFNRRLGPVTNSDNTFVHRSVLTSNNQIPLLSINDNGKATIRMGKVII